MSNPLHVLEDELLKLKNRKKEIEHDIKAKKGYMELVEKDMARYENVINLIKGKGDGDTTKQAKAYKC